MKHMKRYAALFMALVVVCSALALPVSATDYQSTYNFWNWAYDNSWFLGKAIIGFSAGNVCQVSEDGLHHATAHSGGGGSVDGQRVYNCVCDLCGQEFQAVSTDLKDTYYSNGNNGYTVNNSGNVSSSGLYFDVLNNGQNITFSFDYPISASLQSGFDGPFAGVHYDNKTGGYASLHNIFYFKYTPSVDGRLYMRPNSCGYVQIVSKYEKYTGTTQPYVCVDGGFSPIEVFGDKVDVYTYYANVSAGVTYRICAELAPSLNYDKPGYQEYQIKPWQCLFVADENVVNTRPSTFNPSFTYEDGDGWQVHVGLDGNKLIDETNLTYYNPVTNTTTNIQNWSYDYSDRSYTVLTDSNNTTTITYGDEYITINEGDNITYNIYYYTAPDSSGDGDSTGSDGSGDDDGGGLLDKIGELIGSVLGGFIDVIGAALGKVIDSLIDLVTLTIDKLVNVINLFGSFGDALGVLWSWLPEEVVTVLVSGVTVIVFASVIKLFMR